MHFVCTVDFCCSPKPIYIYIYLCACFLSFSSHSAAFFSNHFVFNTSRPHSSDSASSLLPQARNKPKEAPTAPAPAPFFLPTVGGTSTLQRDVQFALPGDAAATTQADVDAALAASFGLASVYSYSPPPPPPPPPNSHYPLSSSSFLLFSPSAFN